MYRGRPRPPVQCGSLYGRSGYRFDQSLQRRQQAGISLRQRPTPTARPAHARLVQGSLFRRKPQLVQPGHDCRTRQARGPSDHADAPSPSVVCLRSRPLPPPSLVHFHDEGTIFATNSRLNLGITHAKVIAYSAPTTKTNLQKLLFRGPLPATCSGLRSYKNLSGLPWQIFKR